MGVIFVWCIGYRYSVLKCGAGGCVVCDMCGLLDACVVWLKTSLTLSGDTELTKV